MLTWAGFSERLETVTTRERRCPRTLRLMHHLWRPILVTVAEDLAEAAPPACTPWSQSGSPFEYEWISRRVR